MKSTPIRGGIPICWPQFGPNIYTPRHGFARTTMWEVASTNVETDKAEAVLKLTKNNVEPSKMENWPFEFELEYTIKLTQVSLDFEMKVMNHDTQSFDFKHLFHNYFQVEVSMIYYFHESNYSKDIGAARINGLKNVSYIDQVLDNEVCVNCAFKLTN